MAAGNPGYRHHVIYRDEHALAFLNKYPTLFGHVLVAPIDHREQVVGDFAQAEYLALQRIVYTVGGAVGLACPAERIYVYSLGSQQANAHVHWHITPMPAGVPYEQQQVAALAADSWVTIPDADQAELAARIRSHLGPPADGRDAHPGS